MSDYINSTSDEYIQNEETKTLELVSENEKEEVNVEEQVYGINKPYRITLRAKISHDKD